MHSHSRRHLSSRLLGGAARTCTRTHTYAHTPTHVVQAFVQSPPERRGSLARALSALAAVSAPDAVGPVFRTAVTRLLKVRGHAGELLCVCMWMPAQGAQPCGDGCVVCVCM